jgi:hypothetical protein
MARIPEILPRYDFMELGPTEVEMFALLDLISAEWQSDPTSVACFDLRLVAKVKAVVEKHRKAAKATVEYMAKHGRSPYDLNR